MLQYLMTYLNTFLNTYLGADEEGQTLVEYGLLLALIAIAVIAVIVLLGPAIAGLIQQVMDNF